MFRGQKAAKVLKKLASLNIAMVSVPANMIHFFQPLDLTINGEAKRYMKDKFSTWYSDEVKQQIESRYTMAFKIKVIVEAETVKKNLK